MRTIAKAYMVFRCFCVNSVAFSMLSGIVAATERQQKEQNRAIYMLLIINII